MVSLYPCPVGAGPGIQVCKPRAWLSRQVCFRFRGRRKDEGGRRSGKRKADSLLKPGGSLCKGLIPDLRGWIQ